MLFSSQIQQPLTEILRPSRWEDLLGNTKVVETIRKLPLHSFILYGPPGIGKTSLVKIMIQESSLPSFVVSATHYSTKEIRKLIDSSSQKPIILFLDEIHRLNKSQQDVLLPLIETKHIILLGATTENPGFSLIPALLSRCQIYKMHPLEPEELKALLEKGIHHLQHRENHFELSEEIQNDLIHASYGDARKLIRFLELCFEFYQNHSRTLTKTIVRNLIRENPRLYDTNQDLHYDYISAFIKSLRGSDPDAALLYLAVMLEGGEDPLFIARRMIIFASEDIGNASPSALQIAVATYQAVEKIGMPEAKIILSQCCTFLASSPKSNASYLAIQNAIKYVQNKVIPVPNHLRNPISRIHRQEGAGKDYLYPHDFPHHFIKKNYFPESIPFQQFYFPGNQGIEKKILQRLQELHPERKYQTEK